MKFIKFFDEFNLKIVGKNSNNESKLLKLIYFKSNSFICQIYKFAN